METSVLFVLYGAYDPAYHGEAAEAYGDLAARLFSQNRIRIALVRCSAPPRIRMVKAAVPLDAPVETRALLDALLLTAAEVKRLKPKACTVVLITDGRDDASLSTADEAADAVAWLKSNGAHVAYVGLGAESAETAKRLGLEPDEAAKSEQTAAAGLIDLAAAVAPYFTF